MRATSSACVSVIVVAKEFQLFHPIGGRGASNGLVVAPIAGAPAASLIAPAPANAPFSTLRRLAISGLVIVTRPRLITQSNSGRYVRSGGAESADSLESRQQPATS